ncbi:MAG: PIG-L family deacetylase [Chloroflexota bacterium]
MRKLLAIFAHPDDEGAIASTLAHYAALDDTEVMLICATKGEAGEIGDPSLATPDTLPEVRAAELRAACDIIGIQELHFLGYRDSGMEGTPPNEDPRALVQADPEEAIGRIVALMRQLKPDVVITFEPFGWYGHPDHKAVYRLATEAYKRVGQADTYPEAGTPWQPHRLFYAVMPVSKFEIIATYATENNIADMSQFAPQDFQVETEAQITHIIEVPELLETKQQAMWAHKTQYNEEDLFRKLPQEVVRKAWGNEHFILIEPSPSDTLTEQPATDLFAPLL